MATLNAPLAILVASLLEFAPAVGLVVSRMSVSDFGGSDNGVEQRLGCGDGVGSRSSDVSVGFQALVLLRR